MIVRLPVLLLAALLSACASGPKYSEIKGSIPELDPERGRIYFYRPSAVGAAVQPNILLNGSVVGEMVPHGFFFVDRAPGTYLATARTESEASLEIPLGANQTRYVRGGLSIGFFVGRPTLTLVEPADALLELADLAYIGDRPLGAAGASPPPEAPASGVAAQGGGTQMKDLEGLLQEKK
jgi:hypothetical protein